MANLGQRRKLLSAPPIPCEKTKWVRKNADERFVIELRHGNRRCYVNDAQNGIVGGWNEARKFKTIEEAHKAAAAFVAKTLESFEAAGEPLPDALSYVIGRITRANPML